MFRNILLFSALGLCAAGCNQSEVIKKTDNVAKANVKLAKAVLSPTKGNTVKGQVAFLAVNGGVKIVGDIEGMTPGLHGFHIHEFGDCSAPDGSSAGAHFNPTNHKHGARTDSDRHVGDLGNIEADAQGRVHFEIIDNVISLGGKDTIVGRSVIVHEKADDFKTQPSGDAGARQACGVIVAQP